jgi:23S rRNA (cytidine1920-2'-O)/16S rRNA (cytidine1409-2'-O)-methyltransferase
MKQRLDLILVERGIAPTRSIAQSMIMAGEISLDTTRLTKPGQMVEQDSELDVLQKSRYVSRGGDKLASVAEFLQLDFDGKILLDVGSSTGGFTDYALQHGAKHSYAVDVGTNQLAFKLRNDERITVMEQTDIRSITPEQLALKPDIAVIDASFISLTKILPATAQLVRPDGQIIAMAKPQFETDKVTADQHKGVITDPRTRREILDALELWIKGNGFNIVSSVDSAVHGAKGNIERFYLLRLKDTR